MGDGSRFTRRRFLQFAGLTTAGAAGLALYSGEIARHEIDVVEQTIRIRRLPDAFHGYRIVQVSDLHFKEFTEEFFLRRVIARINALKPELVVITGDFISQNRWGANHSLAHAYQCGELLKSIECPLRYGIMGNHDASAGGNEISHALIYNDFPILRNDTVAIEREGKRIWLSGLQDWGYEDPDVEAALPGFARNAEEPVVMMVHEPDFVAQMRGPAASYVDLVLSGHTHGGQIRLPGMAPFQSVLPPKGRIYPEGLFHVNHMQLYVNRGIGTTEVPFRLNCPPEITVLTLEQGVALALKD